MQFNTGSAGSFSHPIITLFAAVFPHFPEKKLESRSLSQQPNSCYCSFCWFSSSASSFTMLSTQGMAIVTAMVAFSGTVILLSLRSCISSDGKDKKKKKKTEKKVQFAEDVVDSTENGEEFGRRSSSSSPKVKTSGRRRSKIELPANRVALYNGILKDRFVQKLACSY